MYDRGGFGEYRQTRRLGPRPRGGGLWTLEAGIELNANLVHFGMGGGVGEHLNDEVEVIIVSISGSGFVRVDGEEHPVSNGTLTFMPRGVRRSTRSLFGDFAYPTVHRRRGPLQVGRCAVKEHAFGKFLPAPSRARYGRTNGSKEDS